MRSLALIALLIGGPADALFSLHAQSAFWQESNGSFSLGDVTHLALNPAGDIFAGTNFGIYRSTNEGTTWTHLTGGITFSLAVAPDGDVYTSSCDGGSCGLFRSTNNGVSWNPVNLGVPDPIIYALAIRTTGDILAAAATIVYRSTDNGAVWTPHTLCGIDTLLSALAVAPGLTFAGLNRTALPFSFGTINRSTDNGDTWTAFSPRWNSEPVNAIVRNSAGFTFAATGAGIRRSTDFGSTWTLTGGFNGAVRALAIDPLGHLYAGSTGGVYRSTNRGDSWTPANSGMTNRNVNAIAVNANAVVYAGTTQTGVFRSADSAATWSTINPSMFAQNVSCLQTLFNGTILAGTNGDGIFASTDNGDTWYTRTDSSLPGNAVNAFHQTSDGLLFAGFNNTGVGVARSSDDGFTWTSSTSGLGTDRIFSLAGKTGGQLLAGGQMGVYRSTDNGGTWSPGGTGPASFVRSLIVTPPGDVYTGSGTGVHVSTDNGVSWSQRNSGLTDTQVRALVLNRSGLFFAGTGAGVFRSTDAGGTWLPADSGLVSLQVFALGLGNNDDLFASTDSGVFRSTNDAESWFNIDGGLPQLDPASVIVSCFGSGPSGYFFAGLSAAAPSYPTGVCRSIDPLSAGQSFALAHGWNMISFPLTVTHDSVAAVFPTASTDAFVFAGSYIPQKRLVSGPGYWLKFDAAQSVFVPGAPVVEESLAVASGWNLIGSVSSVIDTAAVLDTPDGTVISPFYAFDNGYGIAPVLAPGRAYWVKCAHAGVLRLGNLPGTARRRR